MNKFFPKVTPELKALVKKTTEAQRLLIRVKIWYPVMETREERLREQQALPDRSISPPFDSSYRNWVNLQESKARVSRKREERREKRAKILHKIGYSIRLLIATFLFGVSLALFLVTVLIMKDLIGLVPVAFIWMIAYAIWPKRERK